MDSRRQTCGEELFVKGMSYDRRGLSDNRKIQVSPHFNKSLVVQRRKDSQMLSPTVNKLKTTEVWVSENVKIPPTVTFHGGQCHRETLTSSNPSG
ncbi:hypothetical protein NPIL_46741 [Nephila pilipes]|uniref:Uncharacterized protein n=1 Tax=Nephila pilipes TaxID=299642 RepID=A0A8X6PLN0_NEPPI|nr:hypothetical protein NPIL_46741 [Nephila pilipes]